MYVCVIHITRESVWVVVHAYTHTYMYTGIHMCMHSTCIQMYSHGHKHSHGHISHIPAHRYTRIYTYIHMYAHRCKYYIRTHRLTCVRWCWCVVCFMNHQPELRVNNVLIAMTIAHVITRVSKTVSADTRTKSEEALSCDCLRFEPSVVNLIIKLRYQIIISLWNGKKRAWGIVNSESAHRIVVNREEATPWLSNSDPIFP